MARLFISATRQSSGKTAVTVGIAAALRARGVSVQPFKKGPDYIDPMWIGRAAQRPCFNLDFHTMSPEAIQALFEHHSANADLALIEGTKGLFDGLDPEGADSNAALAHLLEVPVLLVIDAQGMTRGVAPLVLGHLQFDTRIRYAGLVLNNLGGRRHEKKLRSTLERYTDVPVLGAIPRDERMALTMRHLGLMPSNEARDADTRIEALRSCMEEHVDLDGLLSAAGSAPPLARATTCSLAEPVASSTPPIRIGIARDSAFGFYYPDDLLAIESAGAELIPFDTLNDGGLPDVDGLLIGGGFPETHLEALEKNRPMREAILDAIEGGMPCYAECGGLMYLSRAIQWKSRQYEMVGVLPGEIRMHDKPVGRGYTRLQETEHHPWPKTRVEDSPVCHAHEFHYSEISALPPDSVFAYRILRGVGIDGDHDGIVYKNLLACYSHLRQVGGCRWVERFVQSVRHHKQRIKSPPSRVGNGV
ncbi:MAG: hydrogenobyrinic acid a,c-diamide synthase (glutamine-hydrolyzing) [Gammaproteobacteria bacterium]